MSRSHQKSWANRTRIGIGALCVLMLPGALQSSEPAVCPKSAPPAKTLWAVRIEHLAKESEERLPLSCLQGLVNREQPRIFLAYDRMDERWLDWLRERGDVKTVHWVGTKEFYEQFLPIVKGLVITDPDLTRHKKEFLKRSNSRDAMITGAANSSFLNTGCWRMASNLA